LEALPHLVPRLQDHDTSTRASAVRAVAAIARAFGKPVVDALVRFGAAASASERAAAMHAMGEAREPAVVPDLIRELAEVDREAKAAAHTALVRVTLQDLGSEQPPWLEWWERNGGRHRIEWLIDALTHDDPDKRLAAAEELRVTSRQYFGYAGDLPPKDRERAQQRYRDWWITEGKASHQRL
jgi:HEAT repeat protein